MQKSRVTWHKTGKFQRIYAIVVISPCKIFAEFSASLWSPRCCFLCVINSCWDLSLKISRFSHRQSCRDLPKISKDTNIVARSRQNLINRTEILAKNLHRHVQNDRASHVALWYNIEISVMVCVRVLVSIYFRWNLYPRNTGPRLRSRLEHTKMKIFDTGGFWTLHLPPLQFLLP